MGEHIEPLTPAQLQAAVRFIGQAAGEALTSAAQDVLREAADAVARTTAQFHALAERVEAQAEELATLRAEVLDLSWRHDDRQPILRHVGGWRPYGGDYEAGDAVTSGGSAWLALVDRPKGRPGQSQEWRLIVKAGRDGRDGRCPCRGADHD